MYLVTLFVINSSCYTSTQIKMICKHQRTETEGTAYMNAKRQRWLDALKQQQKQEDLLVYG